MDQEELSERGVLKASDERWEVAVRQAAVISRLAASGTAGLTAVDSAAAELELSRRQVYVLLGRWRAGGGVVSDLLPGRSSGRGRSRLPDEVEAIVRQVLQARYLTRQRRSVAAVCREISRLCRVAGLEVPSRGTVLRRVAQLDPLKATQGRQGRDAARAKRSSGGVPPEISQLLQQVQMDHTPVDVIVVDERHRLPLGRPYMTVAIDVASRCIVGLGGDARDAVGDVGRAMPGAYGDQQACLAGAVECGRPATRRPRASPDRTAASGAAARSSNPQHAGRADHRRPRRTDRPRSATS
jgi:putative transposase